MRAGRIGFVYCAHDHPAPGGIIIESGSLNQAAVVVFSLAQTLLNNAEQMVRGFGGRGLSLVIV